MITIIKVLMVLFVIAAMGGSVNYTLIRMMVFLGSIFIARHLVSNKIKTNIEAIYLYGYVIIAIIFNPIMPMYLYVRDKWVIIDILVLIFILSQELILSKNVKSKMTQSTSCEKYNKLSSNQEMNTLDDIYLLDDWYSDNSLFEFDDQKIAKDAIDFTMINIGKDCIEDIDNEYYYDNAYTDDLYNKYYYEDEEAFDYEKEDDGFISHTLPSDDLFIDLNNNMSDYLSNLDFKEGSIIRDYEFGLGRIHLSFPTKNGDTKIFVKFKNEGLKIFTVTEFKNRNNFD